MRRRLSLQGLLLILRQFEGGKMSIEWDHTPWIILDADAHNLEVDLSPLARSPGGVIGFLRTSHIGLTKNLGFARGLAELGWKMVVRANGRTLLWAGRETSAISGHLHVEWRSLPEFVRLL